MATSRPTRAASEPVPVTPLVPLPGQVRVTLAHACVQALAESRRVDLLHVKGPALDESLRAPHRTSTDADVLVRPDHVAALVEVLTGNGWRLVTGFEAGSAFAHAANYRHEHWGYVDVHRSFPGITRDAAEAFDELWRDRRVTDLAHRSCPVPALRDQALLLCLHAARGFGEVRSRDDVELAWHRADPGARERIRARAAQLGAEVALAAALGELDELDEHDDRTVALWRYFSLGGSRIDEWRARWRAAPTARARARLVARAVRVDRGYTAMALGHEPSRWELATIQLRRVTTAGRLLSARILSRPLSRLGSRLGRRRNRS